MEDILHHLGLVKTSINDGMNYLLVHGAKPSAGWNELLSLYIYPFYLYAGFLEWWKVWTCFDIQKWSIFFWSGGTSMTLETSMYFIKIGKLCLLVEFHPMNYYIYICLYMYNYINVWTTVCKYIYINVYIHNVDDYIIYMSSRYNHMYVRIYHGLICGISNMYKVYMWLYL